MSTADDVVRILREEGGYRELPRPLKVGSQIFDFSHVLVAGDRANDLVVVLEIRSDGREEELVRGVLGLTLSQVCRVLPIGTQLGKDPDKATRGWLSVLLPLEPLSAPNESDAWEAALAKSLANEKDQPSVEKLLKASKEGKETVKSAFAQSIRDALVDVAGQDQGAFE